MDVGVGYKVFVDDNFHYMDESERDEKGGYESFDAAVAVCKCMVDEYLIKTYKPGMSADDLFDYYTSFGEDPFVRPTPDGANRFSAWNYAKKRCSEICNAT